MTSFTSPRRPVRHGPVLLLALVLLATGLVPVAALARGPGVTRREIRIGVHAPITGAVPLPSQSVQRGAEIFWKWRRQQNKPINGRHVDVVLKNDNYNPSQAVAVCKEMVERDNVFMLSGLMNPEGKDQVQACARYAASVGVPYVSLGTTKTALEGLPNYFTFSMTWPAQGRLLGDFFVDRLRGKRKKNGLLRFDTPNYRDTSDNFMRSMRNRDADLHYNRAISRGAGQAEAQTVVQEMKAGGIDNVFVLVSPTWFLQVLKAADNQDYHPKWTGIGITISSSDEVVRIGCGSGRSISGAKFFSPTPAFDDRNDFDRTYSRAARRLYGDQGDSITWLGWATSRALVKTLAHAGRRLTRSRFINRTERMGRVRTGIMPTVRFRPRDHFGGSATHVLTAKCRDKRWHTTATYKRSF